MTETERAARPTWQWWTEPLRISFGPQTPQVERMLERLARVDHWHGILFHDLIEEVDLRFKFADRVVEGLDRVGLLDRIHGPGGPLWHGTGRLCAYVGADFNLNNELEQSLHELARLYEQEHERMLTHGKSLARYDPARHTQRHFDQSTKHHNAARAHSEAIDAAFQSIAGCHVSNYREHYDRVVAGEQFPEGYR